MPGQAFPPWVIEREPDYEGRPFNPCVAPRTKREWDMDATAAAALQQLKTLSGSIPADAPRGFAQREYGAYLWLLPDGSMVVGEPAWGAGTFAEGRGRVVPPYWPPPVPGAVIFGLVHTHNNGGHLPSGRPDLPEVEDRGNLDWIADGLQAAGYPRWYARTYIAAETTGPAGHVPTTQINVYDESNIDDATNGNDALGPEVNPNGEKCPS